MPSNSDAVRRPLNDIQHHIALAKCFVGAMNYEIFRKYERTVYAVIRCLEIISEASRRLPDELKNKYPSIEWREMAAAGNIYRHEYEDVAARRVRLTLTNSLPLLEKKVEHALSDADN